MNIQSPPGEINTSEPVSSYGTENTGCTPRTSLIKKMESYHEKYRISILVGFGLISSAWATETVNIHERVNNAQAPAHQMQSAAAPVGIQGLHLV